MSYSVELTKSAQRDFAILESALAQRDFAILESALAQRVQATLEILRGTPRPHGCTKLEGKKGAYRMRVGSYRIKYHIDDTARRVVVVKIQHRREVYR